MQEKKRDLAGKIALADLTFLEQKRGTAETDDEKRKREEWEKEKEKIKDTLEWEIEKSEFAKRWEANELDRLHYLALVGDAAALAVRIEERKREYLAEQEQKNQAEKKKAALQSAMKDKMEVDSAKKKEEDDKQGMATAHAPPHTHHCTRTTAHAHAPQRHRHAHRARTGLSRGGGDSGRSARCTPQGRAHAAAFGRLRRQLGVPHSAARLWRDSGCEGHPEAYRLPLVPQPSAENPPYLRV
jgi:hypothetical protein